MLPPGENDGNVVRRIIAQPFFPVISSVSCCLMRLQYPLFVWSVSKSLIGYQTALQDKILGTNMCVTILNNKNIFLRLAHISGTVGLKDFVLIHHSQCANVSVF